MMPTHPGGSFAKYVLLRTRVPPYEYALRTASGLILHVEWHMESAWGVYVRPEGGRTGLHYFEDEVVAVDALPE